MNSVLRIARPAPSATAVRLAIGATWCMLLLVGAWLLVRRVGGHLSEPLPALGLVAFAIMLAAVSAALRYIAAGWLDWRLVIATSLAGWLPAAIAVSLPGTAPGGLTLAWLVLIAGEVAGLLTPRIVVLWRASRSATGSRSATAPRPIEEPIDDPPSLAAEIQQELTRSSRDGVDSLIGRIRARFAAGQKTQVLHVAFCPPFAGEPETEIELLEGEEAQVSSSQAYSYGLRMELRRRESSRDGEAIVGFSAIFTPASPDSRSGGE
jgi:hypothetical protein